MIVHFVRKVEVEQKLKLAVVAPLLVPVVVPDIESVPAVLERGWVSPMVDS